MEEGLLPDAPVWTDLATFRGGEWRGLVDCVSCSYPCQPFSKAGSRLDRDDGRYLWPHVARVVGEVGPEWVFLENVNNHLRVGFRRVAEDLRGLGYRVAAGLFAASEVGSPHLRQRLFAVAHSGRAGGVPPWLLHEDAGTGEEDAGPREGHAARREPAPSGRDLAVRLLPQWPPGWDDNDGWELARGLDPSCEPAVLGVADGLPDRVDRCRALGNAVLPVVAAFAFKYLARAVLDQ